MDPKTQDMQVELKRFEETALYKHLLASSEERFRMRLSRLIDLALESSDIKVVRVAQAVRQDASFWNDLEAIRGVRDLKPGEEPEDKEISKKLFRDFAQPDFQRVGDGEGVYT